jgi:hypothetical protein
MAMKFVFYIIKVVATSLYLIYKLVPNKGPLKIVQERGERAKEGTSVAPNKVGFYEYLYEDRC